jgi:hypothetical protein
VTPTGSTLVISKRFLVNVDAHNHVALIHDGYCVLALFTMTAPAEREELVNATLKVFVPDQPGANL